MLVGDTDCIPETDAKLSDEAIQFFLDNNGNTYLAAAAAADAISGNLTYSGSITSKQVGDLKIQYASEGQAGAYTKLSKRLRLLGLRKGSAYAGGISISDKDVLREDSDAVQPAFTVGAMDNPDGSNLRPGVVEWVD